MSKKVIIALGGNALQSSGSDGSATEQYETIKETVRYIADIIDGGYEIGIVHGNGPQIGRIMMQQEAGKDQTPPMPFDVCGAMSQGYIGYQIQQALKDELYLRKKNTPVISLISQVVVDKDDPAFTNPTKPIGVFYSKEEADELASQKGYTFKEDAGRGYRRVVPSPIPIEIFESETIRRLWNTTIVIAAGGGGIPVVRDKRGLLEGVEAVIDKDLAAEKLAEDSDADVLLILTEVEHAYVNFGKENQKQLDEVSTEELQKHIEDNQFAAGSMLPKINAAIKFAQSGKGKVAIISSLDKAIFAIEGKTGTRVVNK